MIAAPVNIKVSHTADLALHHEFCLDQVLIHTPWQQMKRHQYDKSTPKTNREALENSQLQLHFLVVTLP